MCLEKVLDENDESNLHFFILCYAINSQLNWYPFFEEFGLTIIGLIHLNTGVKAVLIVVD